MSFQTMWMVASRVLPILTTACCRLLRYAPVNLSDETNGPVAEVTLNATIAADVESQKVLPSETQQCRAKPGQQGRVITLHAVSCTR